MDYHALEKMTVMSLREEAKKHGAKVTTAMKKDELVHFLAEKLEIHIPVKTDKKKKTHVEMDKVGIRKKIIELKEVKKTAQGKNDKKLVDLTRRRIHRLKRRVRSAA